MCGLRRDDPGRCVRLPRWSASISRKRRYRRAKEMEGWLGNQRRMDGDQRSPWLSCVIAKVEQQCTVQTKWRRCRWIVMLLSRKFE